MNLMHWTGSQKCRDADCWDLRKESPCGRSHGRKMYSIGQSYMEKVKLLFEVIGDLRSLADSLQAVADAAADNGTAEAGKPDAKESEKAGKAGKAAKKGEKLAAKQTQGEKSLTLEEIRAVLAEKSCAGHTADVRELLNKHDEDTGSEYA